MPKTLNEFLECEGINCADTIIMRHKDKNLPQDMLPQLAFYRHEEFNAYQSCHNASAEKTLNRAAYVASFVAVPDKGNLFVGLYKNCGSRIITEKEFLSKPEHKSLIINGYRFKPWRKETLWFDLHRTDIMQEHIQRILIKWNAINYVGIGSNREYVIDRISEQKVFIRGQITRR